MMPTRLGQGARNNRATKHIDCPHRGCHVCTDISSPQTEHSTLFCIATKLDKRTVTDDRDSDLHRILALTTFAMTMEAVTRQIEVVCVSHWADSRWEIS